MSQELVNELLKLAVENGASDIHIKSGKPAMLRISGTLQEVEMDPISAEVARDFVESMIPERFFKVWEEEGQIDFAYSPEGLGRFRVNGFRQRNTTSIAFRHVQSQIPTFEDLNIDRALFEPLCKHRDGIVLMCGATGAGKSSTLASMLNWINDNRDCHVVTLEDPIEYNFVDNKAVFNQREIGIDTSEYRLGLRAALRQDPDIIFVGEMRDRVTFETALSAAETGHLVFSTLHAVNVHQAIMRLFEFFPPEQQEQMRRQVSESIRAVVAQRLIKAMEGGGRLPVVEILVSDSVTRSVIQEGDFSKIPSILEAGGESGSQSFNRDLFRLLQAGKISKSDALATSSNPKALEMNLKGIFLSEGGIIG
ncbi:MAG TPA: PilT/PilU family type 4a pilus ATPase [Opitutales bacterium]|nr:PilT/PilU family type 4a pilus ATPase [Opitutales bacterium]